MFWIPIRFFDENGLHGLWGIAAFLAAASIVSIPLAIYFREFNRRDIGVILLLGLGMGMSEVFYFMGLILTDIVRVVFLFYLLPIWTALISFAFFRVPLGPLRIFAIVLALAGVWLLLGGGGWPAPKNLGDIFALLAGLFWASGLVLIRDRNEVGVFATTSATMGLGFVFAIVMALLFAAIYPSSETAIPDSTVLAKLIIPVLVFGIIIVWPTLFGQFWGARFVAATTAALLTMSEILLATISSTLLIGSQLPLISWVGGGLIICAMFVELHAEEPG